jgi:D-glycero-alpha-D-manno-heptose-7-phosphate kinase
MSHTKSQGIIITQTPFRISFFGGGADFPDYFNQHGATIIGTAIDKYIYVTLNSLERFFEKRIRLSYSKLENVDDPRDLEHTIVKYILSEHPLLDDNCFADIHTYADLPASSGMGSSSSFTVGMLNALYLLNGVYKTADHIAKEAILIEREKLQETGGWQDQVFAAFGGFNRIQFSDSNFTVEPICLPIDKKNALERSCMMFFTGITRSSAQIQQSTQKENAANKTNYLHEIQRHAQEAHQVLMNATSAKELVEEFGRLLDAAWQAKRNLSSHISNDHIDGMYDAAMKAGALGGKLCGAGGGGFLLLIVPEEKQHAVKQALNEYKLLNITFQDQGSRVIYSKLY